MNALLRREDWARERLRVHAGKTVCLALGSMRACYAISSLGELSPSHPAVVPDVTLTLPRERLSELPAVLRQGDFSAIAHLMHVQGEAGLANLISELAATLRWDPEEDLSRVVGDVAAVRLVQGARRTASGLRSFGQRLVGNVGEYLAQESGLLAQQGELLRWSASVSALEVRLSALERRLDQVCAAQGK